MVFEPISLGLKTDPVDFEETEYFDLEQIEANICVYLGFAIIYVVQRLFMFQIKGDSQTDTTTSSVLYRQSLPLGRFEVCFQKFGWT